MGCEATMPFLTEGENEGNLTSSFATVINSFHEGLIVITKEQDTILYANESAAKIYNAGL